MFKPIPARIVISTCLATGTAARAQPATDVTQPGPAGGRVGRTLNGRPMVGEPRDDAHAKALAELHARTAAANLFEFWSTDFAVQHDATERLMFRAQAAPHIWKYREVRPLLQRSGELIDMYQSERRSLIMVNPALRPAIATVTTMFAAYRINLPNEKATAHRHSPNAIRFGLTGSTSFTGVEGEDITFGTGDLVLTPHDTWHNHADGGDADAVNLSVLDMPLANFLNATYFDHDYVEEEGGRTVRGGSSPRASAPTTRRSSTDAAGSFRAPSHTTAAPATARRCTCTGGRRPRRCSTIFATKTAVRTTDHDRVQRSAQRRPVYRTMTFFVQMLRAGESLLPASER